MKVTVGELHEERDAFERDWERLVAHVWGVSTELVLLPEFPFFSWFPATSDFDSVVWEEAVSARWTGGDTVSMRVLYGIKGVDTGQRT